MLFSSYFKWASPFTLVCFQLINSKTRHYTTSITTNRFLSLISIYKRYRRKFSLSHKTRECFEPKILKWLAPVVCFHSKTVNRLLISFVQGFTHFRNLDHNNRYHLSFTRTFVTIGRYDLLRIWITIRGLYHLKIQPFKKRERKREHVLHHIVIRGSKQGPDPLQ